jgi:hypothetical protein
MRPEDRRAAMAGSAGSDEPLPPLDADLLPLDEELTAAGAQARRALHGRTQPTRLFSTSLRDRLVSAAAAPADSTSAAASRALPPLAAERGSRLRPELARTGETWAPRPLDPRIARRTPTVLPRARWSLLAAAALTGVVVAGALGARLDWLLPSPTADASPPPSSAPAPTADTTPGPTQVVALPLPTAAPATEPAVTPRVTAKPAATPRPTPKPTPKAEPTPKPEPTLPPIAPMELMAKACPGGVVLDWTKPSPDVGHYHVLRSLAGDVAPTYPAPGATEIESATSWSAGVTDAYDASLDGGGASATYRAFAFDGGDQVLAYSPSVTVTTVAARSLGSLGVTPNGPGSITLSWAGVDLPAACFTYGKLVASAEDPEPSYLKGSQYLAVIGDPGATGVTVEGLPSGTTVWMRYELIRATSTGKFVVGRTAVVQVTYP